MRGKFLHVATVLTACGIETIDGGVLEEGQAIISSCNSAYRLRY